MVLEPGRFGILLLLLLLLLLRWINLRKKTNSTASFSRDPRRRCARPCSSQILVSARVAVAPEAPRDRLVEILEEEVEDGIVDAPELLYLFQAQQTYLCSVFGKSPAYTIGGLDVDGVDAQGGKQTGDEVHLTILYIGGFVFVFLVFLALRLRESC